VDGRLLLNTARLAYTGPGFHVSGHHVDAFDDYPILTRNLSFHSTGLTLFLAGYH
jgi:hypothetical protein